MVDWHAPTFLSRHFPVSLVARSPRFRALTGRLSYVAMHAMEEGGSSDHDIGAGLNGYSDGGISQRKHAHPQMRETLATMIGMLLPLLTQMGHHH